MTTLNEQFYKEGWGFIVKDALGIEPEGAEAQARALARWAQEEINDLVDRNCKLEDEKADLENYLEELKEEYRSLEKHRADLEKERDQLSDEVQRLEKELDECASSS